jgi:hypothetical protein
MSSYGFVSGDAAIANVLSDILRPSSGEVRGAMPLLYPVVINSTLTKWTWYAPIYWMDGSYDDEGYFYIENMNLHALAMVDAKSTDRFAVTLSEGITGEDLVYDVRSKYVAMFGGEIEPQPGDTFSLTANVTAKESYQLNSETHIVLRTDNSTYEFIEGAPTWMNVTDWYTLLFDLDVGDNFTATIREVNGVYRIAAIVKN